MQNAHQQVRDKIKAQSTDDFRTPEDRVRRAGSDEQVALVQISTAPSASPATSNAGSSSKKQASLHSFLTSSPSSSRKVIQHPLLSKRLQEPKEMRVLKELQEKYDDQLLNQEQQEEGLVKKKINWVEFGKMGGRPPATVRKDMRGISGGKRPNRKGHLDESRKTEFTAFQKLKITEDINEKINQGLLQGQGGKKFWPSEAKKLGINSERLRDTMARQDMWKHLVIKHQLGNKGKKISKKASKHQRASGGGRKRELQPQINQLKDWLEREREVSRARHLQRRCNPRNGVFDSHQSRAMPYQCSAARSASRISKGLGE